MVDSNKKLNDYSHLGFIPDPSPSSSDIESIKNDYSSLGFIPDTVTPTEDDVGMLETILASGAQGATAGFSDELLAGGAAALEKTSENIRGEEKPLSEYYQANVDKLRKRLKRGEELHPTTAFLSEVAGGFIPASKLLKLLSFGIKAAQAGKTVETVKKAIPLLERMAAGVKAGIKPGLIYGGVTAAGKSEEDILSPEMAIDVASGTVAGGLGGAAIGGALPLAGAGLRKAGEAGKAVTEWFGKTIPGKDIKEMYKAGRKGIAIGSDVEAQGKSELEVAKLVQRVKKYVGHDESKLPKHLGKKLDKIFKKASDKGAVIDLDFLQQERIKLQKIIDSNPGVDTSAAQEAINIIDNQLLGPPKTKEIFTPKEVTKFKLEPIADTKRKTILSDELNLKNELEAQRAKKPKINPNDIEEKIVFRPGAEGEDLKFGQIVQKIRDEDGNIIEEKVLKQIPLRITDEPEFIQKLTPYKDVELVPEQVKTREGGKSIVPVSEARETYKSFRDTTPMMRSDIRPAEAKKQLAETGQLFNRKIDNIINEVAPELSNDLEKVKNDLAQFHGNKDVGELFKHIPTFDDMFQYHNWRGDSGSKARVKINEQFLPRLEKINQKAAQSIRNMINDKGLILYLRKRAGGATELIPDKNSLIGSIIGGATRIAGTGANVAGRVVNWGSKQTPLKLKNMTSWRGIADNVRPLPGGQSLANVLLNSENKDEIGRNALIFQIMQKSEWRNLIESVLKSEEQPEK